MISESQHRVCQANGEWLVGLTSRKYAHLIVLDLSQEWHNTAVPGDERSERNRELIAKQRRGRR